MRKYSFEVISNQSGMSKPRIEPHRIKTPIQLLAVWFAALVILDGVFLGAAIMIHNPNWIAPALVVTAIALVPVFLISALVMQTKFRPLLQEDMYYSEWQKRQDELFRGFEAENTMASSASTPNEQQLDETWEERERRRVKQYEKQEGLFLVHSWRPSDRQGWVDIVIWLHQHGEGPLSEGLIERVEYHLGPKFFTHPVIKYNSSENFRLEVSAYGPMLCLARVFVKGKNDPIDLERYIDIGSFP